VTPSNIDGVIDSVDDVKDDLRGEMRKRVDAAMRVLWADVKQYVLDDPHASGNLFSAIRRDRNGLEFSVYVDGPDAPYGAIVEYGSGPRSEVAGPGAVWRGTGSNRPAEYPFDAPDINNMDGFAYYIEQWMRQKGITPEYGSYQASAVAIAKTIDDRGTYAHPYMRPAWFDNELKIKKAARNALRSATR